MPGFFGPLGVVGPPSPEALVELMPAVAGPVFPVPHDWVPPVALGFPDSEPEVEFDAVFTEPECPPSPGSPEVARGLWVALRSSMETVEPGLSEGALLEP